MSSGVAPQNRAKGAETSIQRPAIRNSGADAPGGCDFAERGKEIMAFVGNVIRMDTGDGPQLRPFSLDSLIDAITKHLCRLLEELRVLINYRQLQE